MSSIPRPEYPRPQFVRKDWLCLNGEWQFEIDAVDSGLGRGIAQRELTGRINVPFCPESSLSGVEHVDFMAAVWYRREVVIPADWSGRDVLLHFQACDYDTTVWVNGTEVGRHRGGFTPFVCALKGVASAGDRVVILVRARDPWQGPQARGKQSPWFENRGCHYTRTTGIWQTVWMEPVPGIALQRPRLTPDVANSCFRLTQGISSSRAGMSVRATLSDERGVVSVATTITGHGVAAELVLPVGADRRRLWGPGEPALYDVKVELLDAAGKLVDSAESYAGLRSVSIDGKKVLINGKSVFQRLVLDQGYYADGIMTAPSDAALKRDIELSLAAGFNGARLHQKVFEERFLYHADKLGYLVWGEFGDWGCGGQGNEWDHQKPGATYITQWLEAIARDYSHPSIIGWCPLNETIQPIGDSITVLDDVTHGMYLATKAMDPTRPVLDASGYAHRVPGADIYDCHDYDQNPETFRARHAGLAADKPFVNLAGDKAESVAYRGQPYFVSEFGGAWWNPNAKVGEPSWGYGDRPKTLEEFYARFEALCGVLLDHPEMFGYCYTQLTDVFQEQNGVVMFDRSLKFDMGRLWKAQRRKAAIE